MKSYVVGGAVRDMLLCVPHKDRDFVVVGSSPEEMLGLGYKQVGNDFPVFLDGEGNEHALARRERKIGEGYNGFEFDIEDVSIEEDLARRDFTINAMAFDTYSGTVIDPYGGQRDLAEQRLKAVNTKTFVEDPVRVLRLARFAARYPNWVIDVNTLTSALRVVQSDEWKSLTRERVFKEMEKALQEPKPSRFFVVLAQLEENYWFKEIMDMIGIPQRKDYHPEGHVFEHTMQCIDVATEESADVRFGVLCHDFGKPVAYHKAGNLHDHEKLGLEPVENFCDRLGVPSDWRKYAKIITRYHTHVHNIKKLRPITIHRMFERIRAYGNGQIIYDLGRACQCDSRGRNNPKEIYPQAMYMFHMFTNVDSLTGIAEQATALGKTGEKIGEHIAQKRVEQIKKFKFNQELIEGSNRVFEVNRD